MRVRAKTDIDAPRDEVWAAVLDSTHYPAFFSGLTVFRPEKDGGPEQLELGARFQLRLRAGSADVGGLIEIVEFDEGCDVAWTSITGIDQRGRWRLRENDDGTIRVELRLSYGAPGGMFGAVADRLAEPQVKGHLRRTLQNLKAKLEEEGTEVSQGKGIIGAATDQLGALRILAQAGIIRPIRPDRLARLAITLRQWGRGPAAGYISAAVICPDDPAIIDDLGTMTFREVNSESNKLAHAFADAGVTEGDGVGIMCRNHRGFVLATVAVAKLGAHALYLNTAFAAPQLTEVVKREKPVAIVYDEEFTELLEEAGKRRKRFVAWHDGKSAKDPILSDLIASAETDETPVPPKETGKVIILTSGTTGTPKGANRSSPQSLDPAISLLSKIPLKGRQTSHIAAPLFHSWGFAHFTLGMLLQTTLVLTRKFDPEDCLAQVERSRADTLVVVPVMMQRIMELPDTTRAKYDTSSLSVVAASLKKLPGDLATNWMEEFGDTLYNLYGSTEVAWATIATPRDMRAAPGTAGQPPRGTVLRLYDSEGNQVQAGQTGRIFVGNEMLFEGYTGGGSKDEIEGLMATGDVGRLDDAGRLFVEGRDDEMIVSGGENVFPKEVEDLLARHDAVAEAAAIGVEDEQFGQRLRAFVVLESSSKASEDDLKGYVKENLARYKVPREVWFLDELPRNATGKVLKRELKELEEAPS